MSLLHLWLASVLAPMAGTIYWLRLPRNVPNREAEFCGLVLIYLWFAAVTVAYWGIIWCLMRISAWMESLP